MEKGFRILLGVLAEVEGVPAADVVAPKAEA